MSSNLALDREGFSIFVSEVQELLSCVSDGVKASSEQIDIGDLQRFVHTLKGVLAVYALDAAVASAHTMEDLLHKLHCLPGPLTKMDRLRLQQSVQHLGKEVVTGLRKLAIGFNNKSKSANKKRKKGATTKNVPVEPPILIPISSKWNSSDTLSIPTLSEKVELPSHTTMAPVLKKYLDTADHLARKMGKKIDIHFSGGEVPLPQTGMTLLFASVLHLIRNAIDHGIEPSAKRLALGKPARGTLHLIARQYRGMFMLCIADDGAGIDTRQVRNLAVRRGLISKSAAARSSQGELVDLIFLPGFSLKQKITTVSGRGIGMDAVKYAVEKHQGRMEINTGVNKGTVMKIMIPYA